MEEDESDSGEFMLTTVANHETVLAGRDEPVPKSWIPLDCQSTCHVVKSKELLKNIKPCRPATMYSQTGKRTINPKGMMGMLKSYLYEDGIANTLSLFQLSKKYRITFDSEEGNCFVVHKGPYDKVIFRPIMEGLYYLDMDGSNKVLMAHVQGEADEKKIKKQSRKLFDTSHLDYIEEMVTLV